MCQANDPDLILQAGVEALVPISTQREENTTVVQQPKVASQGAPQNLKGKDPLLQAKEMRNQPFLPV